MTMAVAFHGIVSGEWNPEAPLAAAPAEASRIAVRQISGLRTGPGAGLPATNDDELPISFRKPES